MKRQFWLRTAQICIATALLIAIWVILQTKPTRQVRLLDGSVIKLVAVTYGTNHLAPVSAWQKVLARLPAWLLTRIPARPIPFFTGRQTTDKPQFHFWFFHRGQSPAIKPWPALLADGKGRGVRFTLADANGYEADLIYSGYYASQLVQSNITQAIFGTPIFPGRSKTLSLCAYQLDDNGKSVPLGALKFDNPVAKESHPNWAPEWLPAVKRSEDLEFQLTKLRFTETAPKLPQLSERYLRGLWAQAHFKVWQRGQPVPGWKVKRIELSDATGNRMLAFPGAVWSGGLSESTGDEEFCPFWWSLWPNEPAYKLSVEFTNSVAGANQFAEYLVSAPASARVVAPK